MTLHSHFSLEQGIVSSDFLGIIGEELEYFLLLLQFERAGTKKLQDYFREKMDLLKKHRGQITKRIKVQEELNYQDESLYYSNWWFSAIHILSALGKVQNEFQIAEHLSISLRNAQIAINHLVKIGAIIKKENAYIIGPKRIHLKSTSPLITRHHSNWRQACLS